MNSFWKMFGTLIWAVPLGLAVAVVSLLWRSDAKEAEIAERMRLECLDKTCDGDQQPKHDHLTQTVIKRYGQWYVGPKEYLSMDGLAFVWPSKAPMFVSGDRSLDGQRYYDYAVEIYLTGRHRWADPKAIQPWKSSGWEGLFRDLQDRGYLMGRQQLTPELEAILFADKDGKPYRRTYYLATNQRDRLSQTPPGISCETTLGQESTCTGGLYWSEDVYADFRFRATHSKDWPAISLEINRVLSLLQKVQP